MSPAALTRCPPNPSCKHARTRCHRDAVRWALNCTPGREPRSRLTSVCLRTSSGSCRKSLPSSSKRSKATRKTSGSWLRYLQLVKARHPVLVAAHRLAVDQAACAPSVCSRPGDDAFNTVRPSCTGARCTIVGPSQLPFGRLIEKFIFWMCEISHTWTQLSSARYRNASDRPFGRLLLHKLTDDRL